MPTSKPAKQKSEWISKDEGASRLGRTTRTLQEYISSGALKTVQQRAESGQLKTLVHAGDLERIIFERDNPSTVPAIATPRARVPSTVIIQAPAAPAAPTPQAWLNLEAAADHCGLPASYIVALIETGELPARNVGPRPGGRWRVCRADLDALRGQSQKN